MGGRRGSRRVTRIPAYAFTPKSLSGLVAWYRADLGVTIATGVSAWADQSGTGDANKNMVQGTAAKQPTRNTSDAAYNNQATLSFNSAAVQCLVSGTWAASVPQPSTTFAVGNFSGAAVNQVMSDGGTASENIIWNNSGANKAAIYAGVALGAGTPVASPLAIVGVFNGGTSSIYISALTAAATGDASTAGRTGITAGIDKDGITAPLNGKIAELGVYSGALSATQVAQLLKYLGARYGITIGA